MADGYQTDESATAGFEVRQGVIDIKLVTTRGLSGDEFSDFRKVIDAIEQYALAAVENHRSRAIPERLGFLEEATMRKVERVGERQLDAVVYSAIRVCGLAGPS